MAVKWAQWISIMLYALVAGVMWGTWLALARTMTRYNAATFLADGKHMIANLASIMAVLMISSLVAGLVVTVMLWRLGWRGAGWLALAALTLMVGALVVTLAVEVPIDNQIKGWNLATLPADWQQIRARWAHFHTVRTFLALGAVATSIGAALANRPRAASAG
jgi:uncharacterized membrane protein